MKRKILTVEKKIAIIKEAYEEGGKVVDTIKKYGLCNDTFYRWRYKFQNEISLEHGVRNNQTTDSLRKSLEQQKDELSQMKEELKCIREIVDQVDLNLISKRVRLNIARKYLNKGILQKEKIFRICCVRL